MFIIGTIHGFFWVFAIAAVLLIVVGYWPNNKGGPPYA